MKQTSSSKAQLEIANPQSAAWAIINRHKICSTLIIVIIGLLFGLIFGASFIASGLEKTLLETSVIPTGGKVYVEAQISNNSQSDLEDCVLQHHGDILGKVTSYNDLSPSFEVAEATAVRRFISSDLAKVPAGKVPVLLPSGGLEKLPQNSEAENLRIELEENFYPVGTYPTTEAASDVFIHSESPTLPGAHPLNFYLSMVYGGRVSTYPLLLDDGSGAVETFVQEKINHERERRVVDLLTSYASPDFDVPDFTEADKEESIAYAKEWTPNTREYTVVAFANYADAIAFANSHRHFLSENRVWLSTRDFVSNTLSVASSGESFREMIIIAIVLFGLIVLIVVIIAFARLLYREAPVIRSYRAAGLSSARIATTYFLVIAELCLIGIACALLIGSICGALASLSVGAVAERLRSFYQLATAPTVCLFRPSRIFWLTLLGLLLLPVVVFPLTLSRIFLLPGAKNITASRKTPAKS